MHFQFVKVLLVEDDENVRITLKAMLEEMGITRIYEKENGADALEFLDENPGEASLILCDWNMPYKTGLELLNEVRTVYPHLPFIMLTARADEDSVLAAKNSKVTGYIPKPVTFERLKAKITTILSK